MHLNDSYLGFLGALFLCWYPFLLGGHSILPKDEGVKYEGLL